MSRITTASTQDLSDVLTAARICFFDGNKTATASELFRASFGGLFCVEGAKFGDKLTAYAENARRVPEVLAEIAAELKIRGA